MLNESHGDHAPGNAPRYMVNYDPLYNMPVDDFSATWSVVLSAVKKNISRHNYSSYVARTELVDVGKDVLTVLAPSMFVRAKLVERYGDLLEEAATQTVGRKISIKFTVPSTSGGKSTKRTAKRSFNRQEVNSFHPSLTFDSFVVSGKNTAAVAAMKDACLQPMTNYNPIFIAAPLGMGKTHLLNAVGNYAKAKGCKALYLTSKSYVDMYVDASSSKTPSGWRTFRQQFDELDVLLIDDLSNLENNPKSLKFLSSIVSDFVMYGRRIYLSSSKSLKDLSLPPLLRSRIHGGLQISIVPPGKKSKAEIVSVLSQRAGVLLSEKSLSLITNHPFQNVQVISGLINQIKLTYDLQGAGEVSHELIRDKLLLMEGATPAVRRPESKEAILNAVAKVTGVRKENILGKSRIRSVSHARKLAAYTIRTQTKSSHADIGKFLGGREHNTIQKACSDVDRQVKEDKPIAQELNNILQLLR